MSKHTARSGEDSEEPLCEAQDVCLDKEQRTTSQCDSISVPVLLLPTDWSERGGGVENEKRVR